MFRTVGDQPSLFESVLPEQLLRLPEELIARVDALLDDPAFLAPFVPFFDPRIGRPSTPMETYLRMMFLKFRYRLGYESLCREDERLDRLAAVLPDPAGGVGAEPDHVDEAHRTLWSNCRGRTQRDAVGQGGRGEAVRAPTGSGWTRRSCRPTSPTRPTRVCWPRPSLGSRPRSGGSRPPVGRRAPRCGTGPEPLGSGRIRSAPSCGTRSAAGKDEAQAAVRRVTSELADLAQAVAKDADRVLANAKQALRRARAKAKDRPANGERDAAAGRRRGRLARAVNDLNELVGATRKIAAQTRQRLRRDHTPGRHPPSQPARPRRPADRQGPAGQTGRVRPQGPGGRQRRRRRSRLHRRARQPGRRAAARPSDRTDRPPYQPDAPRRHRRSRLFLRRAEGRRHPPRARGAHRSDPPERQTGQGPTGRGTPTERSEEDRISSGEPASKAGSAPSNAATDGTEPASTEPTEPRSGPATESWPTT